MKYKISILILLCPLITLAQFSGQQPDTVIINELVSTWSAGLHESGNEGVNIRVFNKFKELFWPNAVIDDDIDAVFFPASPNDPSPYKTAARPFEYYAHNLALHFNNLVVSTEETVYDRDSLERYGIVNVKITKTISGEKWRQYVFETSQTDALADHIMQYKNAQHSIEIGVNDTMKIRQAIAANSNTGSPVYQFSSKNIMNIRLLKQNDTMKINSIRIAEVIEPLKCINDDDADGVINKDDRCPKQTGDLTAHGCIDSDLDGINDDDDACDYIFGTAGNNGCPPDFFSSVYDFTACVGLQLTSTPLALPDPSKLGYNDVDLNESKIGSLNNPALSISPVVGFECSRYFGSRKKNAGLSLGVNYTGFQATYEMATPSIYVFKSNDGANDYRRRVTLEAGSTEDIRYRVVNIPLYFKYRKIIIPKNSEDYYNWEFEFSAGPSFLLFSNTSKYNATVDFEGLYQVDTVSRDDFTYYDYFDHNSTWNVYFTADSINAQAGSPGAQQVFSLLNDAGYDFASGKKYSGTSPSLSRTAIAINAKIDVCYNLGDNNRFAFKFGAYMVYAPMPDQSSGYQFVDSTADSYLSFYQSKAKTHYFAFGLNAGIVLRW